jgi:hypothetical protein
MSTTTTAKTSPTTSAASGKYGAAFWERLWRLSGINFVLFFVIAWVVYGSQPHVGASADTLRSFYDGDRTRILIAAPLFGLSILNLMWFAMAVRNVLAEAGRDGWGSAAIASSAAAGAMLLLFGSVVAALAYSIAGAGNTALTSGLNDFAWAILVLSSWPRAMLVMSWAFGLWRAELISNALFGVGVAFVVLGVLGGTTWLSGGFWAPDGAYARYIWPGIGLVWVLVVSRVILTRPATRAGW